MVRITRVTIPSRSNDSPAGIPDGITREDILRAIADFDSGTQHGFAASTKYDLVFEGKRYPPKAIVGLAARRVSGHSLTPYDFKGGEESRCFRILRDRGFDVQPKPGVQETGFWIFKCNPKKYHLFDRLRDPFPIFTWYIPRYRDQIQPGDTAFIWVTGEKAIRAVIKIDEAPRKMAEFEREIQYWREEIDLASELEWRAVVTLTHRTVNLSHERMRQEPGLSGLSVIDPSVHPRATVFTVRPEEGRILLELVGDPDEAHSVPPGVPLSELRQQALAAATPSREAQERETVRRYYERSAAVRAYVLARAAGVCESCKQPAPFHRLDGTPYLEPHHTTRLADEGPDHPRFVGAVCPSCHAEIHRGSNGEERNRRLQEYLAAIEPHDAT